MLRTRRTRRWVGQGGPFTSVVESLERRTLLSTLPEVAWARQIGTSDSDGSYGVAVDAAGNAYISGYTVGSLGAPSAGSEDAFLTRYNADGTLAWSRQIGTGSNDESYGVAVDAAGNAYITGSTYSNLGGTNAGEFDAFLTRYNADGTLAWSRQIGTSRFDYSLGVAIDAAGNAYITGSTTGNLGGTNAGGPDAFLTRYNADGTLAWSRQIGTTSTDISYGVAVDAAGNAYISGYTFGDLGGTNAGNTDAFLTRYNADGTLAWSRQIGTSSFDLSRGVAVDAAGNAYITGSTDGSLGGTNAGGRDAFLTRYNADGTIAWIRQIGTSAFDGSFGVAVDAAGNAYISGITTGSLAGPKAGGDDAFITRYNADGTLAWSRQIGTSADDVSFGVAVDVVGNAYISGYTEGSLLGGTHAGFADAFLVKWQGNDIASPQVTSSTITVETAQQWVVTFNEPINPASLNIGAVSATRIGQTESVAASSVTWSPGNTVATFTFPQLADGDYRFNLAAGAVKDLTGNLLASPVVQQDATTFILAGDANRDRRVDFSDLLALARNYNQTGRTFSQGNFDYSPDGLVDFSDLVILARNYNVTLPAAGNASTSLRSTRAGRFVDSIVE